MTGIIISIVSLVLALYVGFKRRTILKTSNYYYLGDMAKHHPFMEELYRHGDIRGIDIVKKQTVSILGSEREEFYLELVFNGSKKIKVIKL